MDILLPVTVTSEYDSKAKVFMCLDCIVAYTCSSKLRKVRMDDCSPGGLLEERPRAFQEVGYLCWLENATGSKETVQIKRQHVWTGRKVVCQHLSPDTHMKE